MKIKIQYDKNGTVQISKINECNQEFHMFHLAKNETVELDINTNIVLNGQKTKSSQYKTFNKTYIYLNEQKIEFNKDAARCILKKHPYICSHYDTAQIETIVNELCFRVDSLTLEVSDFHYPSGKTPEAYYTTCIIRYLKDQHSLQDLLKDPDDGIIFEYTPSLETDTSWYYLSY